MNHPPVHDEHSRMVIKELSDALRPVMARIAPGYDATKIEVVQVRESGPPTHGPQVEVRLLLTKKYTPPF